MSKETQFALGHKKKGGRKKGIPNKMTVEVKTAILEAFKELGGVEYLVKVGEENPQVFCSLLAKVLPLDISNSDGSIAPTKIIICGPDD